MNGLHVENHNIVETDKETPVINLGRGLDIIATDKFGGVVG